MTKISQALTIICLLVAAVFVTAQPAYAYLDPGTGSYMLQLLLAGVFGGLFAVKMFWNQIKDTGYRLLHRNKSSDQS